jgi:hypothetical protein
VAHAVPLAWLVARASGLVALGLLTLSTWLGLAMSTRLLGTRRLKGLLAWHRTLVWTGLSMIGLHVTALLADPTLHFGLRAVLVPFASPYRPGAVAAGVVAGWLTLVLALSFRARTWIGQRGWRRLHYASFAAFALGLGHALFTGTDLRGLGGTTTAALALGPTLWLVFLRILAPAPKPKPQLQPA